MTLLEGIKVAHQLCCQIPLHEDLYLICILPTTLYFLQLFSVGDASMLELRSTFSCVSQFPQKGTPQSLGEWPDCQCSSNQGERGFMVQKANSQAPGWTSAGRPSQRGKPQTFANMVWGANCSLYELSATSTCIPPATPALSLSWHPPSSSFTLGAEISRAIKSVTTYSFAFRLFFLLFIRSLCGFVSLKIMHYLLNLGLVRSIN